MRDAIIAKLEQQQLKSEIVHFSIGDTVSVHINIVEGNKERVQIFTGTIIGRAGKGLSETITVHRVAYGEGMERVIPIHSPRIVNIEVKKHGRVRRAKLNYIRGKTGKKAKVRAYIGPKKSREKVQCEAVQVTKEASIESVSNES